MPLSFAAESSGVLVPTRPLRLRVSPLTEAELPAWLALIHRLPAVSGVRLERFNGATVTVEIDTASISRLHAQLGHLATKAGARFMPTPSGELGLILHGAPRPQTGAAGEEPGAPPAGHGAVADGRVEEPGDGRAGRTAAGTWERAAVRPARRVAQEAGSVPPGARLSRWRHQTGAERWLHSGVMTMSRASRPRWTCGRPPAPPAMRLGGTR